MNQLVTEAEFELPWAEAIVSEVCEHLTEHAVTLSRSGGAYHLSFTSGVGVVRVHDGRVSLRAEAPDLPALHQVRMALAAHIVEYSTNFKPQIRWTGDGADLKTPPNFRIIKVVATMRISPRMRRIVFAGENLASFATDENLHVNLVFPSGSAGKPGWPSLGADGLVQWGAERPVFRKYTIREHDAPNGRIVIDFVDHEDAGPASAWAARATEGDEIGMTGPGGLGARPAGWYLLAGDETALPAIARILEVLPETAKGTALIEVADATEEQPLNVKAAIDVRWLHRRGARPGTTTLLYDAVRQVEFPRDRTSVFAWAAGEYQTFKAIRTYFRAEQGLDKHQHLVVAYWRKGASEDEARSED